ncbi:MAG TPA: efflux transporter outer membrane subunit [Burkholderiales bacterium]|nr:efflux transporter outer membrane subunit [Burkholderiales bacterium]
MIRLRLLLLAAAVAALAGCKAGPDYVRPAIEAPASYKETPVEWKVAQPSDAAPRGRWWEIFKDPQLNALVEQVEISNQNLRAAEAQYRQARAVVAGSRAGLFPTLDANASVVRNRSPSGAIGGTTAGRIVTTYSASVSSSWDLDLWGRIRRTIESSEAGAQASAADLESARLSAQSDLATNYFQVRVLDVGRKILEDTVAAFKKSLELTVNRYKAGVAGKVEVAQAETQLRSAEAQMVDVGVQRAQLEHAIALLIGKAPTEFSLPPAQLNVAMPAIPVGLPSELLERRPDIAAAERRVAAANAQVGVAQAAFFPSVILSATLGSRATDTALWFTRASRLWSIGPAITQSIFDAGLRRSQSDQAIAAYDATVAEYRQAVLSAFREVEDNLAALRILAEEAVVQEDAVRAARESTTLTINQYKAGTVSFLNVAVVQAAQLSNERTAVILLGQRLAATVALLKALGGGWDASELPDSARLKERTEKP